MTDVQVVPETREVATPAAPARRGSARARVAAIYAAAALVVLLLDAAVLMLLGADPFVALPNMLSSSVGSLPALSQTIERTIPLLLGAGAVVFAMRAGLINLGVDGQIQAGAVAATGAAFAFATAPSLLVVPAVVIAGAIGGAMLAAPPAFLRARLGVNELFTTVMLNFVAILAVEYLTTGPWTDAATGEAIGRPIALGARLSDLWSRGPHQGALIALAVVVGLWLLLFRTRTGFTLRATGSNPLAAAYGGVDARRAVVAAMLISGAIAGIAGAIEMAGVHGRLIYGMATNFGYLSVLVAVLSRRSLVGVVPVSFAFGALIVGSDSLQRSVNLPASTTLVFQAVTVITVLVLDQTLTRRGLV